MQRYNPCVRIYRIMWKCRLAGGSTVSVFHPRTPMFFNVQFLLNIYIYIYTLHSYIYIYICIHEYTHIHMFLDALQIGRNLRWTRKRTRCSNVSRLRNWTSPMSLGNHKIQCGKHGYTVCERVLSDFNHWSTIYFRVWGLCNPMV